MARFKSLAVLATCLSFVHAKCRITTSGAPSSDIVLKGTVLTPDGPLRNGRILVKDGKIAEVSTECVDNSDSVHSVAGRILLRNGTTTELNANCKTANPELDSARSLVTVLECTGSSVISPGFINTHEHIAFSTLNPFKDTGERYDHRHDWRLGLRNHTELPAPVNGSVSDATAWGELRHLLSGTTSLVGGYMVPGLARNLDFMAGLEGSGTDGPDATWDLFPLDDSTGILRDGDCNYGPNAMDSEDAGKVFRYMAHVAEGVDAEAATEFKCLSSETYDTTPLARGGGVSSDIIAPNVVLIQALGLSEADFDLVAARRAKIVWSPRSNVSLYGKTLNVSYLLEAGIKVALGTDWLPSGSATMGREAVCGRYVMEKSFGVELDSATLWKMMTINAAEVVGFEQHLGSLDVGKAADIVIFGGDDKGDPFAQAIYAASEDIELVMRGGKVMLAADDLKTAASGACELLHIGDSRKTICIRDELGMSFAAFEASLQGVYPAVYPRVPEDEPSCEPTR